MRDIILTDRGPKPIGPYSQAIRTNGFLYVSGQVALDPKTGEMTGPDIRQQTDRRLENLKGILEAPASELEHPVEKAECPEYNYARLCGNEADSREFAAGPPST